MNRAPLGSRTKEYRAWKGMKERCDNKNLEGYKYYGARGITVCEAWLQSFSQFFTDMGLAPEGTSIDRIDNNQGYSPGNCRWATPKQQQNNTRYNRLIEFKGQCRTAAQWAETTGLNYWNILNRLNRGWTTHRTLTTPVLRRGQW